MTEPKKLSVRDFEMNLEEILNIAVNPVYFGKNWSMVIEFLDQYSSYSNVLIRDSQYKSAMFILTHLQTLTAEVLKHTTSEIEKKNHIKNFFKVSFKENISKTKFDLSALLNLLQEFGNLPDISEVKSQAILPYYVTFEAFLQITNNIAYIHAKKDKMEKAFYILLTSMTCMFGLEYSSYYLKYHLSTMMLNLTYIFEPDNKDEANKLITNTIMMLEKLENKIDSLKNSTTIYNFLNNKSNKFAFLLEY